jgi:hypothetical protein
MVKTFRIGDLVRYHDEFEKGQKAPSVGTIVGWSKASDRSLRDWCGSGPTQTTEYFSELELISGERK